MFTDSYVTPRRLETLVDVLAHLRSGTPRDTVFAVLQPPCLPNAEKHQVATAVLSAARELGLVEGTDRLSLKRSELTSRELVIDALDRVVLAKIDVEPYFALYFSYLLARGDEVPSTRDARVEDYNEKAMPHPSFGRKLNPTMAGGIVGWFGYAGLGWSDSAEVFQCCPYERLLRRLSTIFSGDVQLSSEEFMARLSVACPEMDGGEIFAHANPEYEAAPKVLSAGLANALIELHFDNKLRLHASHDSAGWSLERAEPPNDGKSLLSTRIDLIEFAARDEERE